ncbi:hypothetical protein, partial [Acinetobacter sp. 72431]|uniref:hypothetical protein n=1 Tax=Acinetobacter sp. 72431 TaxID=1310685 RepID=UPI001BB2E529
ILVDDFLTRTLQKANFSYKNVASLLVFIKKKPTNTHLILNQRPKTHYLLLNFDFKLKFRRILSQ